VKRGKFIKDFADRVREIRLQRGLSQEDLAFEAGMHRTAISFIERAERSPTLETIEKLALALDVQPAELMPAIQLRRKR
jgi:transcriptional regulator with XRE-family HTH domain